MIEATRTVVAHADPPAVASRLRDFATLARDDPGTSSCTRLGAGPVAAGARWRATARFLGHRAVLVFELVRDEPELIRFVGAHGGTTATREIALTAGPLPGTTRVTHRARVDFHGEERLATVFARLALKHEADGAEAGLRRLLDA